MFLSAADGVGGTGRIGSARGGHSDFGTEGVGRGLGREGVPAEGVVIVTGVVCNANWIEEVIAAEE